jgi:hypothetical protein
VTCIRNKNHNKNDTVCEDCLKEIDNPPYEPDLNQISPELRALFTQLTLQNKDLSECWKTEFKTLTINKKRLRIENILYAFYKGDIGNYKLKRICQTIGCVNPAHHRSRFESPDIFKSVRTGFNREHKQLSELPDAVWLRIR